MTPDQVPTAAAVYLGFLVGTFLFSWGYEGGDPVQPWREPRDRRRHLLRNLALLAAVVVFADIIVGQQLLRYPERLFDAPAGLLAPLALPAWTLVAIAFVVIDLYEYAVHRLLHRWRPLWLLHAVHHADPVVDFSTSARHHPVETALMITGRLGLYLALGLPVWIEIPRAIVVNTALTLQHTNARFPRWLEALRPVLVTPAVHRMHHSADGPATDRNFGQLLSVWDRWFGTWIEPTGDGPPAYGLRKLAGDRWQTLAGMLATPLAARRVPGPL